MLQWVDGNKRRSYRICKNNEDRIMTLIAFDLFVSFTYLMMMDENNQRYVVKTFKRLLKWP